MLLCYVCVGDPFEKGRPALLRTLVSVRVLSMKLGGFESGSCGDCWGFGGYGCGFAEVVGCEGGGVCDDDDGGGGGGGDCDWS